MKQAIRYFSLGLLISTLLLFGYHFFFNEVENSSTLSVDEMISLVEAEGLHVVSEQDYITLTVQQDDNKTSEESTKESDDKEDKEDKIEKDDANDEQETDNIKKFSFNIKEGMYTPEIGKLLKENEIIEDDKKFEKYMDENGYSSYIQLGKFHVNSEMTLKEIGETLTTYPGN